MSEWWTYRPSDFLMFAPRTYWRLFELHNEAWWPVLPLVFLAGLAGLAWLARASGSRRPHTAALRVGAAGLAIVWAFVAWAFLMQRYAPVNWAASGFALGFFVQALTLAAVAARGDLTAAPARGDLTAAPARGDAEPTLHAWRRRIGTLLFAAALLGYPLLSVAFGRPLAQAEVFGLAPDPTVVATLGLLLWVDAGSRAGRALLGLAWALALAWCAISAATLWTLGSAQGWVLAVAVLIAVAASRWRRPRRARAA